MFARLHRLLDQERIGGALRRLVRRHRQRRLPPVEAVAGLRDEDILSAFPPHAGPGESGFIIDFLGCRVRTAWLRGYEGLDGQVLGTPRREAPVLHEHDEWLGTLAAVLEAQPSGYLTVMELGAGWAPWLVASAVAARRFGGFRDGRLLGVEASRDHHAYMIQNFADNGLDAARHDLLLGAVGETDGTARFPRLPDPAADWGARVIEADRARAPKGGDGFLDARGAWFAEMDKVACYGLSGLLRRFDRIDLVHCDIQGSEQQVIPAAMPELTARVRRIVLGTHGRDIDIAMSDAFVAAGWVLEARQPSHLDARGVPFRDGTQVWRNDAARPHIGA